jgi:hypothetical protein
MMNLHSRPVRPADGRVDHVPYRLAGPNPD